VTLTTELVISIPGHAAPKGSMKCIGGKGGGHRLIEDNRRTKPWRDAVALWIKRSWNETVDPGQPVGVEVTFSLPRPKGHYGTGANAGHVKGSAPDHAVSHSTGDVDKLARLILDAIQDTDVLPDDSAVVELTARKRYLQTEDLYDDTLGYPGVVIRLYPVGPLW
jgi:crossover junction endodeoxyribonuclease RusA